MGAKNKDQFDIIVAGGGLVGLATAVCVARLGFSTLHLSPAGTADPRTSALMKPSVDFLLEAGLIADADAIGTRLTHIRIIDATERLMRAPETLFDCSEAGVSAFAWNFPNAKLLEAFSCAINDIPSYSQRDALLQGFAPDENGYGVEISDRESGERETVHCKLLVGADGKGSVVRKIAGIDVKSHAFAESALVCDLDLAKPIEGTSVEFHYPHGPFTLVPAGGARANLVWIDEASVLKEVLEGGEDRLIAECENHSAGLFGAIKPVRKPVVFPLATLTAETAGRDGVVLAGESAHAFPPIGAQGLNLGLRDVADLIAALKSIDAAKDDWAKLISADYAHRRANDLGRTTAVVDTLFRSLLSGMLPTQMLRAGGLWLLKMIPGLRARAFEVGMGTRK